MLGTDLYQNMLTKLGSILIISKKGVYILVIFQTKNYPNQCARGMLRVFFHFHFKVRTRVGKIFSAARLGTEKPPCVLVSLAVKVLQKKSVGCRFGVPISGAINRSFSCYKVPKESGKINAM